MSGFGLDYLHHSITSNTHFSLIAQNNTALFLGTQIVGVANHAARQIKQCLAHETSSRVGNIIVTAKSAYTAFNSPMNPCTFYSETAKPTVKNIMSRLVSQCKTVFNTGAEFLSKIPAYGTRLCHSFNFRHATPSHCPPDQQVRQLTEADIEAIYNRISLSTAVNSDRESWEAEEFETNIGRVINMEIDAIFPKIKKTSTDPMNTLRPIADGFLKEALTRDLAKNVDILRNQPEPKKGYSSLANSNISQLSFDYLYQTHGNKNKTDAEKTVNRQAIGKVFSKFFPDRPPLEIIRNDARGYLESLTPAQIDNVINNAIDSERKRPPNGEPGKQNESARQEPELNQSLFTFSTPSSIFLTQRIRTIATQTETTSHHGAALKAIQFN